MDANQLLELKTLYRTLPRGTVVALVIDLIDMARENAVEGTESGLDALVNFANNVAGPDALTIAKDAGRWQ
jgi:hypothetical protein